MAKGTQKKNEEKRPKVAALILLVIMLFSVAGFALMGVPFNSQTDASGNPQFLSLQEINYEGQTYWVAIEDGEQFVYESIEGFDQRTDLAQLATSLKEKESVQIYVDESFTNSNARFLTDKALRAFNIEHNQVQDSECTNNKLIFTNPENEDLYQGECLVFSATNEEALREAEIVTYHFIN